MSAAQSGARGRRPPAGVSEHVIEVAGVGPVRVRRGARRRKTVQIRREGGMFVLAVPAAMPLAHQHEWAGRLAARMRVRDKARPGNDEALFTRSLTLSKRYLGGRAVPAVVCWVDDQATRWGSCTSVTGRIRIARRVGEFPGYVLDYVLVHELSHLLVNGHGPDFWALAGAYPQTERARGFLEGVLWGGPDPAPGLHHESGDEGLP